MPSAAFNEWQNVRMSRLAQIDGQCAAIVALVPLAEYRLPTRSRQHSFWLTSRDGGRLVMDWRGLWTI
jgi:hypothetical protein